MKNKKGNLHIDWVISIGIFLTYIILLITFIKPSYEPSFEGDVLVNLAKNKFYNEAGWEVKKILLSFDCNNGGVHELTLQDYIPDIGSKFKIVNEKTGVLASYSGSLKIKLFNNDDKFRVFYNELVGYESADDPGAKTEGMKCEIGAGNPIIFRGISEQRLDDLNMDKLAENFPEFRQFKIRVLDSNGNLKNNYCFVKGLQGKQTKNECDKAEPPADIIVYGVNLGNAILDKNAELQQVVLNIQVW